MTTKPWFATYKANNIPATINADAHPSVVHMLEAAMTPAVTPTPPMQRAPAPASMRPSP